MNEIVEERTRQGKTQKRLAYEAGIAARTLRKLERGEDVSLETLRAVRKALGLPSAPRPRPILPYEAETNVSKSWLARKWDLYGPYVNLAGLGGSVLLVVAIAVMMGDLLLYELERNATLSVTVAGECTEASIAGVSNQVVSLLPGAEVLHHDRYWGTGGCTVRLQMHVDDTQAEATKKLRTGGLTAEFLGFRE